MCKSNGNQMPLFSLIEEIVLQFIFSEIEALFLQLNQKITTDCHPTCKSNDNQMSHFGLIEEITHIRNSL